MASRSAPRARPASGQVAVSGTVTSDNQVGTTGVVGFFDSIGNFITGKGFNSQYHAPPQGVGGVLKIDLPLLAPIVAGEGAAGRAAASAGTTGAADAGGSAAAGSTAAGGEAAAAAGGSSALKNAALFGAVGSAITSPLDFLKFIAWVFHPRNIVRMVEFLVGFVLMIFGLQAAMQSRGERAEGFATSESALSRAGLGRVARELGSAAATRQRPRRPQSAPHVTRRTALRQRYAREEKLKRTKDQSRRKA